mmetsp:Transcript_23701/g.74706  ORF Transcript_23701/g.74706 Transcript_23701/m.74706 type:complete len:277 (+) Transcript_23701:31-861(+)
MHARMYLLPPPSAAPAQAHQFPGASQPTHGKLGGLPDGTVLVLACQYRQRRDGVLVTRLGHAHQSLNSLQPHVHVLVTEASPHQSHGLTSARRDHLGDGLESRNSHGCRGVLQARGHRRNGQVVALLGHARKRGQSCRTDAGDLVGEPRRNRSHGLPVTPPGKLLDGLDGGHAHPTSGILQARSENTHSSSVAHLAQAADCLKGLATDLPALHPQAALQRREHGRVAGGGQRGGGLYGVSGHLLCTVVEQALQDSLRHRVPPGRDPADGPCRGAAH